MAWSEDDIQLLIALNAEGLSASAIAYRINKNTPRLTRYTRNAVIGKLHRMGLVDQKASAARQLRSRMTPGTGNLKKLREKRQASRMQASRTQAFRLPGSSTKFVPYMPGEPMPQPDAFDLARLPHLKPLKALSDTECRFPIGDPKDADFGFCALPAKTPLPYCEAHVKRAYTGLGREIESLSKRYGARADETETV